MSKRIRITTPGVEVDAEGFIVRPASPTVGFHIDNNYLERMALQRSAWAKQDRDRYLDPDDSTHWNVYAWVCRRTSSGHLCGWASVGNRPIRNRRRKSMTMNRLFAAIRQQFGLHSSTPIRLITTRDDDRRRSAHQPLVPPQHFGGKRT